MSTVYKRVIAGTSLTTSNVAVYTVGTSLKLVIHRLAFTNYHPAANGKINVYLVPSGQSPANKYKVVSDYTVLNDRTFVCNAAEGQVLDAGGSIYVVCDTPDCVTVVGSGVEITV